MQVWWWLSWSWLLRTPQCWPFWPSALNVITPSVSRWGPVTSAPKAGPWPSPSSLGSAPAFSPGTCIHILPIALFLYTTSIIIFTHNDLKNWHYIVRRIQDGQCSPPAEFNNKLKARRFVQQQPLFKYLQLHRPSLPIRHDISSACFQWFNHMFPSYS